jgi:hypothetical protein
VCCRLDNEKISNIDGMVIPHIIQSAVKRAEKEKDPNNCEDPRTQSGTSKRVLRTMVTA